MSLDNGTNAPASVLIFPPELEQVIFVQAARDDLNNVVNYLLVAKHIYDWVIRVVFEVVVLHKGYTYPKNISLDQIKRYGHHVRHLLLYNCEDNFTADQCLVLCPNTENLALWTQDHTMETVQALITLPLKRFSIGLSNLLGLNILKPQLAILFSNITHLDLSNDDIESSHCKALAAFRVLTHLAVWITTDVELIKELLERFSGLKVLIWLSSSWRENVETKKFDVFPNEVQDMRLVEMEGSYVANWVSGARGREDIWSFAERVVQDRREKLLRC